MNRFTVWQAGSIAALVALMVAGVMWGSANTEAGVEQAINRNFAATGVLAQLQVQGEKMRRFEKEAFIYVAVPERRAGYVKEFDTAYGALLETLDRMLAPSGTTFQDEERTQILAWKQAAVFYGNEFHMLARRAADTPVGSLGIEQRAAMTLDFNERIKAGKDRFRELLTGTEAMREAKAAQSQRIATELRSLFNRLRVGVLTGGLLVAGIVLVVLRGHAAERRRRAAGLPAQAA